jgi:hypothetical protein
MIVRTNTNRQIAGHVSSPGPFAEKVLAATIPTTQVACFIDSDVLHPVAFPP